MWVKSTNTYEDEDGRPRPVSESLYRRDVMGDYGPVEFNQNATARVPQEIGEAMVEHYPNIEEIEKGDGE